MGEWRRLERVTVTVTVTEDGDDARAKAVSPEERDRQAAAKGKLRLRTGDGVHAAVANDEWEHRDKMDLGGNKTRTLGTHWRK